MNGVVALPCPRTVSARAARAHIHSYCSVAATFDETVGGLTQDSEFGVKHAGQIPGHATESVQRRRDLFVIVEHPRHVNSGLRQLNGELQHHRDTGLHVDRATTDQHLNAVTVFTPHGQVVGPRHGIDVTGNEHTSLAFEGCARNNRVTITRHGEVRCAAQDLLDGVGKGAFVARDRLNVAKVFCDRHHVERDIKRGCRHGSSLGQVTCKA